MGNLTHGHTGRKNGKGWASPTYRSWIAMKSRRGNANTPNYYKYGGKGIAVCDRWMVFSNFLEDMGVRPEKTTLDRIDSESDYTPENCRWSDIYTQNNNRDKTKLGRHPNSLANLRSAI